MQLPLHVTHHAIAVAELTPCRNHNTVGCRFLTVYRAFLSDSRYTSPAHFVRVIVHDDPEKLALWSFVEYGGKTLLQIQENRDPTGAGTGRWYLADPGAQAKRDGVSTYLAVTPHVHAAMAVAPAVAVRG